MIAAVMLPMALFIAGRLAVARQTDPLRHDASRNVDAAQGGFLDLPAVVRRADRGAPPSSASCGSIVFFIAFLRWPARCSWTRTLVLTTIANAGWWRWPISSSSTSPPGCCNRCRHCPGPCANGE
jgi:hypothetical protein